MGPFFSTQQRVEVDDSDSSDMDSETEDFVADAARTDQKSGFPSFQSVTEAHVLEIEKNLETYEKVSLTYLLYEEPHIALQNVNMLLADKNYNNWLIDWVKYECSLGNKWQEKLMEALTIIQNYEVLRKLGFMKKDMYERFLPLNKTKTLFVNPLRKCLYRMCEDFTKKDTLRFLSLAGKDLKDLPEYNVGDVYLEKYLLYFETEKYITCNEVNDADVKNIIKICKYMELDNLQNELEVFSPGDVKRATEEKAKPGGSSRNSPTDSDEEQFELEEFDKKPGLSSGRRIVKSKGKTTKTPQLQVSSHALGKEKYDISPENPGIVVIINNEHFYSEYREPLTKLLPSPKQLDQREGTEEDKKNLKDTFEHFGFKIVCFDDLTHEAIKSKIKATVKEIDKESSFFVIILSHGDEGVVYGTNSIPLKVSEIQTIMCAPALAGKPKVLILQCCQGNEVQDLMKNDDLATDGPLPAPKTSDMFVFWATVPGYSAIRHKKSGTWFIQALCKMMKEKQTYHFQDICVFTQKEVTEKRWHHKVMVPLVETTLSKFLYLPNPNVK